MLLIPQLAWSAIPDEEFQALRREIGAQSAKSPLAGIAKADEILASFDAELAPSQRIRIYYIKSWHQINADRIEEAMRTLADARLLANDIEEPGILYSYYSISASAFANLELYELALESHLSAYKEAPLLKSVEFIHQTENNIGHIYLKLGLLEEAEEFFQRFYDFASASELPSQQGTALNNLGEVAWQRGDLSKALELHTESLRLRRENNYKFHESWSLFNLGRVYFAKNDVELAKSYLQQAITHWESQGATSKTLQPRLVLADTLVNARELGSAEMLLEQVIKLGEEHNLYAPLREAFLKQSQLLRLRGDAQGALEAMDQYNAISEALAQRQSSLGLAFMLSQTEVKTKEMALQQLEQQHKISLAVAAAERRQGWVILASGIVIILITFYFLYRLNRRKQELQNLLRELEATQAKLVESEKMRAMTTLVSGMAHQLNTPLSLVITSNSTLVNEVNILSSLFSQKKLTQSSMAQFIGKALELVDLSQKNGEKAANMIQRFKMISAKLQTSELTSFELLSFLQTKIASLAILKDKHIALEITGQSCQIKNYAPVVEKVFTQLVENSVKHGFEKTQEPKILIELEQSDESQLIIHYKDNGSGIPHNKRKEVFNPFYTTRLGEGSLGLGLNVIYNSVVHLMNGHVECVVDAEGAHFVLFLPSDVQRGLKSSEEAGSGI